MKQRLVGALVLVSLALILIPLLLDGEGVERPPLSANIPPAPAIETTPLPEPERPEILADALMPETTTAPGADPTAISTLADATAQSGEESAAASATDTATPVTEPAEAPTLAATMPPPEPEPELEPAASATAPALDAAGLPEAWVVRVGVFGEKANAERLTARLTADGYKAFIRPVGVSSGVFIGPEATQNDAAGIQRQLNEAKVKYQIGSVSVQRYAIEQ